MRVPTAEEDPGEDRGGQSCPGPASSPAESQLYSQAQPHITLARHLHKGLQSQDMTRVCLPHPLRVTEQRLPGTGPSSPTLSPRPAIEGASRI